jgi:hypothetical protein
LIASLTLEERLTFGTYPEVAEALGMKTRQFQNYMAQGCPGRAATPGRQDGHFFLPDVITWCRSNVWKPPKRVEIDEYGDPMSVPGDPQSSPALEEYRKWRAKLAELDYQARKGNLIDVAQVNTAMIGIAQSLRLVGEQIAREYGNGPVEMLNGALSDMEQQIAEHFDRGGEDEEDDEEEEDLDDFPDS